MNNKFTITLFLIFCAFFISSCSVKTQNKKELVLWTDMTETEALKKAAARFEKQEGYSVRIVRVPFEELQPKFQVAAPVRKGPDLITGPHDWVGPFATAELISPIEISGQEKSKFLEVPIKTLSFKGKLYGLPISMETLGLIYNKKFIKKPPSTMRELITIADCANRGKIEELKGKKSADGNSYDDMLNYEAIKSTKVSGFLYEIEDFYFSWGFLGGFGAYIFKDTPEGLDPYDIGLAKAEAVKAMHYLMDLKNKYNLIPQGMSKDIANGRFMENDLLFTINGPWALVDYKKQKIDFGFAPLPKLENGRHPAPFVGVQGIYLNSRSEKKAIATKLMKEICSQQGQVDIYLEGGRVPSRYDSQEDKRLSTKVSMKRHRSGYSTASLVTDLEKEENEDLKGILEAASNGTPMPNLPELGAIWTPMKEAIQLIMNGKQTPEQALPAAQERIKSNVERMRR